MLESWENGCYRCPTNHYTLRCIRARIGRSKASTTKGNSPNVQHKHEIQQIDSNTHPIHRWHVTSTIVSIIQLHKQPTTQNRPSASPLQHYETHSSPFLQENQGYCSFVFVSVLLHPDSHNLVLNTNRTPTLSSVAPSALF